MRRGFRGGWIAVLAAAAVAACNGDGTGASDPCAPAVFKPGSTASGALDARTCRAVTGPRIARYVVTFSGQRAEEFALTTTQVDGALALFDSAGHRVAYTRADGSANGTSLRVFAPRGRYLLAVSADGPRASGAFELTSHEMPAKRCEQGWIVPPITVTGTLQTGDCTARDGSFLNLYRVHLEAFQTLQATQRSTAFDSFLALRRSNGGFARSDDNGGGGHDAHFEFAWTVADDYVLYANSHDAGESGAYTLTLSTR